MICNKDSPLPSAEVTSRMISFCRITIAARDMLVHTDTEPASSPTLAVLSMAKLAAREKRE